MRMLLRLILALSIALAPASANAMLPGMTPIIGPSSVGIHWVDDFSSTSNSSSFNFGNFTAPVDGLMVVLVMSRGDTARTISSVSIGGSSGTLANNVQDGVNNVAIAYRSVTAGAQNVTVNLSGSRGTTGLTSVGVWVLTGLQSNTPIDTDSDASSSVTSQVFSASSTYGGVALMGLRVTGNVTGSLSHNNATDHGGFAAQSRTVDFADSPTFTSAYSNTASWSGSQTTAWLIGTWR